MGAPYPVIPRDQRRTLAELKKSRDVQGSAYVKIEDLLKPTGLSLEALGRNIELLIERQLVEWHFYSATPQYSSSEGHIKAAGYDLVTSTAFSTRLTQLAAAIVPALASSIITAVIGYASSPQAFSTVVGSVFGGTLTGSVLLTVVLRRVVG